MVPWWNKKLTGLRAKTRKLFNIAKITGQRASVRRPSPVTIKRYGKPSDPHGGGAARRSMMYRVCDILSDT
jgi:hypothetical protein